MSVKGKSHWIACLFGFLITLTACSGTGSDMLSSRGADSLNMTRMGVYSVALDGADKTKAGTQLHVIFSKMLDKKHLVAKRTPGKNQIVFTFAGAGNKVKKVPEVKKDSLVKTMSLKSVNHSTELTVDLAEKFDYTTSIIGRDASITLTPKNTNAVVVENSKISGLSFQRKADGGGDVVVLLDKTTSLTLNPIKEDHSLLLAFPKVGVAKDVDRHLDVSSFRHLVNNVSLIEEKGQSKVFIKAASDFEYSFKKFKDKVIVTFKPVLLKKISNELTKAKKQSDFEGKPISFNFQSIKVASLLQIIADFAGLNLIVNDSVQGSMSLKLKNVPWDQVLDIVLKSQGLSMRRYGTVILVAPSSELTGREVEDLLDKQKIDALSPLYTEVIRLHYAGSEAVEKLIKDGGDTLLSSRGQVNFDQRTNSVWIKDTVKNLDHVRRLLARLDKPEKQVLIEARIVTTKKGFERDIGVRLGLTRGKLSGTLKGSTSQSLSERLNFNIPASKLNAGTAIPASIGMSLFKLDSRTALDLELSALEDENFLKLISSPRLVTSSQKSAFIESGTEIPYSEASSSGATSISFKKAVLSLKVTPRITPNNKIVLDLKVTEDTPNTTILNGDIPAIDTQQVETQILLNNGETVVLGGIYTNKKTNQVTQVPFLGKIPILGNLFKHKNNKLTQTELLVFVTPRIIDKLEGETA